MSSTSSLRPPPRIIQISRHRLSSLGEVPYRTTLLPKTQQRNATFIPRPRRPYQFTQLITLSDGSTFTQRTTSPIPIFKSQRDTRNTALWNPSNAKLANVEEDEAGRLRAFRRRFGRGWDVGGGDREEALETEAEQAGGAPGESEMQQDGRSLIDAATHESRDTTTQWSDAEEDNLMDLISEDYRETPMARVKPADNVKQPVAGKAKGGKGQGRR
ncbi:MAG: hypothetical protein M1828_007568 [Chrysothrix sp. TS-e1954]|nr:MAG: hypothetical protein M1828_007568 [Chrysothrix sp. TS-e1954]